MLGKNNVRSQQNDSMKNLLFVPMFLFLIAFHVWNTRPVDAIVGAVEDGLVAYWSFDKHTVKINEHAEDIFAGLVATVKGDPVLASPPDCKVGECVLFDGNVDYLLVEDSDPPKINRDWNEITIECWTYITALDDSWNRIISLDDMPTNSTVASLYYDDDDNRHGFFIRTGGKETEAAKHTVPEDIPIEQWIHLAGTYDGETAHYYVNGKLEKTHIVQGGKIPEGGLFLSIGDRSDGCDCDTIQGYVDEFRIYQRALSEAEVENNMNAIGLNVTPSANYLSVTWGHIKARRR